jgi:exosortase/archaeosortase family protein
VDGYHILIGGTRYVVLNECAGLAHFLLGTFLGYGFGLLLFRSFWKVTGLAIFGALIGILSNALRVSAIVLIDSARGSQMPLTSHTEIQWLALLVCLGLLFAFFSRLEDEVIPETLSVNQGNRVATLNRWAPVMAGFAVFLIVGGWSWRMSQASPVPIDAQMAPLPRNLGGWELAMPAARWSIDPQKHTRSLAITYQRDGIVANVKIVETTSPGAKLPESEMRPGESNIWLERSSSIETGCADFDCSGLWHTVWLHRDSGQYRHVYWTYALASLFTHSKLAVRAKQGWNSLNGNRSNPRLIGIAFDSAVDARGLGELAAAFRLLNAALESENAHAIHENQSGS